MGQNKNSKRTIFIGGGALLFVILGITVISFHLIGRAQQDGDNTIICRGGTPSNWIEEEVTSCSSMLTGTTRAIRCKNANAYIE